MGAVAMVFAPLLGGLALLSPFAALMAAIFIARRRRPRRP